MDDMDKMDRMDGVKSIVSITWHLLKVRDSGTPSPTRGTRVLPGMPSRLSPGTLGFLENTLRLWSGVRIGYRMGRMTGAAGARNGGVARSDGVGLGVEVGPGVGTRLGVGVGPGPGVGVLATLEVAAEVMSDSVVNGTRISISGGCEPSAAAAC